MSAFPARRPTEEDTTEGSVTSLHVSAEEIGPDWSAADNRFQRVVLETPLESIHDSWPVLRAVSKRVAPGGTLVVRYAICRGRRFTGADVANMLRLAGFDARTAVRIGSGHEMTGIRQKLAAQPLSCSVVVPCRNEVGNVDRLVVRVPALGTHTELIFVDGASTDGTPERIEELIRDHPDRDIKLLHQQNRRGGKAAAVFQGFDAAEGDVLLILDADMTVAPEDLPRFYLALAEGVADFANGSRFLYPMEAAAMPGLNDLGNRAFRHYLSWVLGTRITDSLCGTKALFRRDWPHISTARKLFGGHDPWGDFDLLLGAAYERLRLIDVPIRYGARVAGESKMQPFRHGLALAQTCFAGARQLKWARR